jgi:hypothetical protein
MTQVTDSVSEITNTPSDTEKLFKRYTIELEPGPQGKTEVDFATKARIDRLLEVCRTMQDSEGNGRRHYIPTRVALAIVREMFPRPR